MPQIGPLEIIIVAVLALVVFGPEKLPEMARSLGKGLHQLKGMASDVKSEFDLSAQEDKGSKAPVAPESVVGTTVVTPAPASKPKPIKSASKPSKSASKPIKSASKPSKSASKPSKSAARA